MLPATLTSSHLLMNSLLINVLLLMPSVKGALQSTTMEVNALLVNPLQMGTSR